MRAETDYRNFVLRHKHSQYSKLITKTNTPTYRCQRYFHHRPIPEPTKEHIILIRLPNARQHACAILFLAGRKQLGTPDVPDTYSAFEAATREKRLVRAKSEASDILLVPPLQSKGFSILHWHDW